MQYQNVDLKSSAHGNGLTNSGPQPVIFLFSFPIFLSRYFFSGQLHSLKMIPLVSCRGPFCVEIFIKSLPVPPGFCQCVFVGREMVTCCVEWGAGCPSVHRKGCLNVPYKNLQPRLLFSAPPCPSAFRGTWCVFTYAEFLWL